MSSNNENMVDKELKSQGKVDCQHEAVSDHQPELTFRRPTDFPRSKKWTITISAASLALTSTFASSIFSPAVAVTATEFGVSETITILGVSLYVLGFGCGPILWGPMSDFYGRRLPLFTGFALFTVVQIPLALTPTLAGLLICRFLAGCFGAAPLTIVGAVYSDFWDPAERGIAMTFFSICVFAGPTCGPIVGSFLVKSKLGWRWTAWITLIMAALVLPTAFFLVPETYLPVLERRARKSPPANPENLLKQTVSTRSTRSTKEASRGFVREFLFKPAVMLCTEPVLAVTTVYISLAYGLIYLSFFAVPYSFDTERGWDSRIGSLAFVPMLIGVVAANIFVLFYTKHYYQPRLRKRGVFTPDDRVPLIMLGALILPIGLFWFGWTSSRSVSWLAQIISLAFVGTGIMLVFSSCTTLLVDVYLTNASSVLAASTCVRSIVAAGLPLAGPKMYANLGTAWATSTLGFICVAMIPAPFLFYRYSASMRARSEYAFKPPQRRQENVT